MSRTNQRAYKNLPMPSQSRGKAYGKLNILWKLLRPDLDGEDADTMRAERLQWIKNFLGLQKLDSTKDLSDAQLGRVLDEMTHLTGQKPKTPPSVQTSANVSFIAPPTKAIQSASDNSENVVYLSAERASEEQKFTIRKLLEFLEWTEEYSANYLIKRGFPSDINALRFKKAHPLTMILLNSAAHKDLKSKGLKTGRTETAKHIKFIKKTLQIGE